jgi:hypothetical protein
VKDLPARKGPPERDRPWCHNSSMRPMSRLTPSGHGSIRTRMPQFIVHTSRMAWKPECISAQALRAQARARASPGHTPGVRSARYSTMASVSQITASPSTRQGTRPVGEKEWNERVPNGTSFSSNGMPSVRISTHGRSDQEE